LDDHEKLPTIRDNSPPDDAEGNDTEPPTGKEAEIDENAEDSSSATLPPDSPPLRLRNRKGSYDASTLPNPESITVETLDKHMYTASDPPLDIFVRTSGVQRLSDFMLWQCHQDTQIFFLDCFWPDFDLQHFVWVLLEWQWRQKAKERDEGPAMARKRAPRRLVD
jgi:ditrans,polycis-polyprenyl diphosphate synthase